MPSRVGPSGQRGTSELIVIILVWTVLLDIQVLVSDIPVSSPQYCDNDLILHVAMAYTVNLRQYYGHTGAEWLARNKGKHAAVHSARVGVPLCTGRQPSRNGRVRETSENMRLSIPRGLASRCARDANPRGMEECKKQGKTCGCPFRIQSIHEVTRRRTYRRIEI